MTPQSLLVIDDDKNLAKIIARAAERYGFTTHQCSDPTNAFDAFMRFRPQIVMLDMCMPEKDGIEILEEMLLAEIPAKLILMSGYGTGMLREAVGVAKFHDHPDVSVLSKPFRVNELGMLLQRLAA